MFGLYLGYIISEHYYLIPNYYIYSPELQLEIYCAIIFILNISHNIYIYITKIIRS